MTSQAPIRVGDRVRFFSSTAIRQHGGLKEGTVTGIKLSVWCGRRLLVIDSGGHDFVRFIDEVEKIEAPNGE